MSEKVTAMIEEIKGLTVLELSELVHALEEEFGVSAAAMAAPAAGGAAAPAAEEKDRKSIKRAAVCHIAFHLQRVPEYLEKIGIGILPLLPDI